MSSASDNLTARVFFALWPTAVERAPLVTWQSLLERMCGGRAMRGETLHVTLVFIGEVPVYRLEALQLAAQEASTECFELYFDEARYWGHNHIVYAAPRQLPRQLAQLVGALEQRLRAHRFKFDSHHAIAQDYQPHVTLLRNAHWSDTPLPAMQQVCWRSSDFALVQSVQRDGLTDYRVLARFPLAGDGG
ncbi:MAG: RNA 2',3'-cyclic phosphodiesterase [Gallionella sp.]|nr:RNA 2',3'-cyclic phosphodiesterase [Gallionella sp.]